MTRARKTGARRTGNRPTIWTLAALLAAGFALGSTQSAEAAKSKAAATKSDSGVEVERAIDAAIAALEAGKVDHAVQELTSAISGGKVAQKKLARALYYRGLAYRKQGKPAQAIADFTSALWIKNGLDEQQRADALLNRAGAYREAGLSDQAEADEKRVAATAAARRQGAAASAGNAPVAAPQPAASSGGGLGSFFDSLFGSAPAAQEPVAQGFATSVSTADSGARQGARAVPAAPTVSGWSSATVVSKADSRQPAAPATTASTGVTVTKAVARTSEPDRGYHVQVAAVRSRNEAQAVAARLAKIGAASGNRDAAIEEAVMGNMGTLYRVSLGPFGSATEVQRVCPQLRDAGLDCLIIDR